MLPSLKKVISNFKESKWFALSFICLLIGSFIILTSEVQESLSGKPELIGIIDEQTIKYLLNLRSRQFNEIAIDITALGSAAILSIIAISLTGYFLIIRKYANACHLILAALGSTLLTKALKFYFERSRPEASLRLMDVDGYSYPSGHSLSSTAIYFTTAVILSQFAKKKIAKRFIWTLFLSLILFIGITRIYLAVHYFSDVLAGVLIGIAWASFIEFSMTQFSLYRQQRKCL